MRHHSPLFVPLASNVGISNQAARALFISINAGFGAVPALTGAILVARRDGYDLLPKHVEALCAFCAYVLGGICGGGGDGDGMGGCGNDMGGLEKRGWESERERERKREERQRVFRGLVTRGVFEGFWREFCEERGWRGCVGPYDVGRLGRGYGGVVRSIGDGDGCKERVIKGEEKTRTEGLMTRGLARKMEGEGECDSGRRRKRESSSEDGNEGSDVVPAAKRRRIRYLGDDHC